MGSPKIDLLYKVALLLALAILLVSSWDAPISGDEYVHVKQAEKNINYLQSLGENKEALDTPISRLKHYGQSFDTVTSWLADILDVDNLYRFRHVSNAVVAWLIILFASLLAFKISQSKIAAFITVILFLVSARFMGHAMNNLKDIPFTFAFIFSIYFIFRFVVKLPKISWLDLGLVTLGIAFGISIRIGGLLIFAYFILFTSLYLYFLFVSEKIAANQLLKLVLKLGMLSFFVFVLSYFSSILIWPYALESPLVNPLVSLDLMHQYPTTVRQIFEGKLYWSDTFPWYYLFKFLLITLPLVVLLGFACAFIFIGKLRRGQSIILSLFLLIAFGFPLFYTSVSGANVYGGWRQLLFCYPPMVVLASIGIWSLFDSIKEKRKLKMAAIIAFAILLYHPIKFSVFNYPYQYIYFNQLVGGTRGAYGNYELDYYFTSFKKAYEYIDALEHKPNIVAANLIIPEYYKGKSYQQKLIDYYDRSNTDWDYAIVANTFLNPYQLKEGIWPPTNTIFSVYADGQPILAILKRETKAGLEAKHLMNEGAYENGIEIYNLALTIDGNNESILLNLARAYVKTRNYNMADATLDRVMDIYPENEWAMEQKGMIYLELGKEEEAKVIFQKNIENNYKFYHSYVSMANVHISEGETDEAIKYLKSCLKINPFYEPAYKVYGRLLIERGEVELGTKMLNFTIEGNSKYGRK